MLWIWECKNYQNPLSVDDVEEFHAKLQQIGSDKTKGTIVLTGSIQGGAQRYAASHGIGVIVLNEDDDFFHVVHMVHDAFELSRSEFLREFFPFYWLINWIMRLWRRRANRNNVIGHLESEYQNFMARESRGQDQYRQAKEVTSRSKTFEVAVIGVFMVCLAGWSFKRRRVRERRLLLRKSGALNYGVERKSGA